MKQTQFDSRKTERTKSNKKKILLNNKTKFEKKIKNELIINQKNR